MTTATRPAPLRTITRQYTRRRLEEAMEDVALLLAQIHNDTDRLHDVRGILAEIWEGTQPDAAPELEISTRVVRAS